MKAAVVTGVSTGIGKDIALTLCEHGYKVLDQCEVTKMLKI